ncbi:MAG: ATP-binding protein [Anaerostipes sp.]|nr:ATP-binding protein [Anaerostipes sp.]
MDFNIINTMETSKNKLATEYSFTLMHISLVSLSSTFCHIILFNLYLNKRAKEKELEFIREHDEKIFDYYRRKLEDEELIKIMRHDLKNQLLVMKHNINGKSEEYIDSLLDELSNVRYEIDTGNVYLDVLLSEKISCIREKDIELSVMVNYKDIDFILDRDVCSLFGNILDNCIEAVEKLETNRLIIFKCNIIQNQLCIHAENTFKDNPQIKNGRFVTTKNNADGHGLGILSIKKIVSNYKGNVTFLVSDKKFVVNINIPISYKV